MNVFDAKVDGLEFLTFFIGDGSHEVFDAGNEDGAVGRNELGHCTSAGYSAWQPSLVRQLIKVSMLEVAMSWCTY